MSARVITISGEGERDEIVMGDSWDMLVLVKIGKGSEVRATSRCPFYTLGRPAVAEVE